MDELERLSNELKQFLTKFNKRILLGLFTQLIETSSLEVASSMLVVQDECFLWAIKYDDLDVFLRTLKTMRKKPQYLIDFLIDREFLHGHVICSDELQICGGYLTGKITTDICQGDSLVVCSPDLASIFDEQYRKGLGFKNERHWKEKHDGRTLFI